MRIHVFDPAGSGLGTALGLRELGHDVVYAAPHAWWDTDTEAHRMLRGLAAHRFRLLRAPGDVADGDLLVVVDAFGDHLAGLAVDPDPEGAAARHARRVQRWMLLAERARRTVIVDASDDRRQREAAFAALPDATLLARECGGDEHGPWQPFPFLYNNVLLWAEHVLPGGDWFVPLARRQPQWDWTFCGTVDHPRYRGRRRPALELLRARWPDLTYVVRERAPFVDVLRTLQQARCGVDLPGAGELCFRLHEYLALGVPVVRPRPFTIRTVPGLAAATTGDPPAAMAIPAEAVTEVYRNCYAPIAAARWLLAAVQRPATAPLAAR